MTFIQTLISFFRLKEYRELLLTTLGTLLLGALVYQYLEGWAFIDSFYFSFITLSTVGYGDFVPQTNAGKIFTIFYTILGVGLILTFINTVYLHYSKLSKKKKKENKIKKKTK